MNGCVLRVTHQGRTWEVWCASVEEAKARWHNLVKSGYHVETLMEETDGREGFDEDEEDDSLIGRRVCASG